ncbi:MAG: hypothetical protein CVT89_07430, partial [Candidatus Altiarchaeales archaeon HGW-Altiarchaeales-2]
IMSSGSYELQNISFYDELPYAIQNFTKITNVTSNCTLTCIFNDTTANCTNATLPINTSCRIYIDIFINDTNASREGFYTNTAHLFAKNIGPIEYNCTTEFTRPSIHVTKSSSKPEVYPGEILNFTVTVTNKGKTTLCNTTLIDTLPSVMENLTPLEIYVGNMSPDETKEYNITVRVKEGATPSNYSNRIEAISRNCETTEPVIDTYNTSITVLYKAENVSVILEVNKTANVTEVHQGDYVNYTIVIKNTGSDTAYNVTLNDTLLGGFDLISGPTGNNLGNIPAGGNLTINIIAKVRENASYGNATNIADVTALQPDNINISGRGTVTVNVLHPGVVVYPNITVTKTSNATDGNVKRGDAVKFTINVTNNILPGGFNASPTTFDIGNLSAGNSSIIEINANVLDNASIGGKTNKVTVIAYTLTGENITTEATANVNVSPPGAVVYPNITVTKTSNATDVKGGDIVKFTINVTNIGTGTAYDVTITDILPGGFNASPTTFDIGNLSAGNSSIIEINATVLNN